MEVKMERSNHLNDEDRTEVDKEDVAQGWENGLSPLLSSPLLSSQTAYLPK